MYGAASVHASARICPAMPLLGSRSGVTQILRKNRIPFLAVKQCVLAAKYEGNNEVMPH